LSIVTCVGSQREMRLEAINKEVVHYARMKFMQEKIGRYINPDEKDEQ
jgi:hypothetical protein